MRRPRRSRGFAVSDLLALLAVLAVTLGLTLPVLSGSRGASFLQVSMGNLTNMGFAQAMYAADWNGRQHAVADDTLSLYGNTASQALAGFEAATGEEHPPLLLGWGAVADSGGGIWGYFFWGGSNAEVVQAISFNSGFGHFRIPNSKAFHDYVGGRHYDPVFYAPADTAAWDAAGPWFDDVDQYVAAQFTGGNFWSSYCTSPAALYDHQVLRAPSAGGYLDPFLILAGTASPPVSAAAYPDLKTRMIEHNWNQAPPAECNPAFGDSGTYQGCEPYYFNMGLDSNPVTLFFDGSVRVLPNEEVLIADQAILEATNGLDGLWHRGTPLGPDGYFIEAGYDGTPLSHHILTINGILGRDTISMPAARRSRPGRQKGSPLDLSDGSGRGLFLSVPEFVFAPVTPGSYSALPDIQEDFQ